MIRPVIQSPYENIDCLAVTVHILVMLQWLQKIKILALDFIHYSISQPSDLLRAKA